MWWSLQDYRILRLKKGALMGSIVDCYLQMNKQWWKNVKICGKQICIKKKKFFDSSKITFLTTLKFKGYFFFRQLQNYIFNHTKVFCSWLSWGEGREFHSPRPSPEFVTVSDRMQESKNLPLLRKKTLCRHFSAEYSHIPQ